MSRRKAVWYYVVGRLQFPSSTTDLAVVFIPNVDLRKSKIQAGAPHTLQKSKWAPVRLLWVYGVRSTTTLFEPITFFVTSAERLRNQNPVRNKKRLRVLKFTLYPLTKY